MKLSERVKPISWFKAHAPEAIRDLADGREPMVITLRGEARAVLQDIDAYERTQETLALLKVLALTGKTVEDGRLKPAGRSFADIRKRAKARVRS